MIRREKIVGPQYNGPHAQHSQRPREWGSPQCNYYGSVKHNDPAALNAEVSILSDYILGQSDISTAVRGSPFNLQGGGYFWNK